MPHCGFATSRYSLPLIVDGLFNSYKFFFIIVILLLCKKFANASVQQPYNLQLMSSLVPGCRIL